MDKARILVVEDEGIVAEDIQMSLEDFGYHVTAVVTTGEEAVQKAQESQPDLVLMDVVLQGEIDGIEAAGLIQSSLGIPVIYLTAFADDEMLKRAKITEPFGYLIKPFRDRDLRSSIEIALYRHKLDTALKESREWLSVTLNSIGDAVIATDPAGLVQFMNPVAQQLTGWDESAAQGRPLSEVAGIVSEKTGERSPDAPDGRGDQEAPALNGGNLVLTSKDGTTRIIDAKESPIRDHHGNSVGMVVVFRDITDRKRSEERLELLSEAVQQTSEGIALTDLQGNVTFLNRAFAELHGVTPEDVIGKHLSVFHLPEQMAAVDEANSRMLETGQFSGEIWHARQDGTVFPGLMHNSILRDQYGNPRRMIGTLRDITEMKAAEEALRAGHEALAAYSSSLEAKVEERTKDLEKSQKELRRYSESLEKTNEALKIIIEGIEEQRKDAERKITHNLNLTVKPILDQLKSQETSETVEFLLKSLEFNLSNMFSSFGAHMVSNSDVLTPKEMRICEMIRSGLSSKQIAKVMGISAQTVLVHRKNIRRKLSLSKSRRNLASFLRSDLT